MQEWRMKPMLVIKIRSCFFPSCIPESFGSDGCRSRLVWLRLCRVRVRNKIVAGKEKTLKPQMKKDRKPGICVHRWFP